MQLFITRWISFLKDAQNDVEYGIYNRVLSWFSVHYKALLCNIRPKSVCNPKNWMDLSLQHFFQYVEEGEDILDMILIGA